MKMFQKLKFIWTMVAVFGLATSVLATRSFADEVAPAANNPLTVEPVSMTLAQASAPSAAQQMVVQAAAIQSAINTNLVALVVPRSPPVPLPDDMPLPVIDDDGTVPPPMPVDKDGNIVPADLPDDMDEEIDPDDIPIDVPIFPEDDPDCIPDMEGPLVPIPDPMFPGPGPVPDLQLAQVDPLIVLMEANDDIS